jgi:DNA-binding transcriptional ArsR family regulator
MKKIDEKSIDQIFFALSDQSRRSMLLRLSKGPLNITELGEPFGMTKQAVSKHLKVLESAGLITKEKDGRIQRCLYNPTALETAQVVVEQYREFWGQQLNSLDEYIENLNQQKGRKKND